MNRDELKAKEARIRAEADKAYSAGDKVKGRRLDDEAHAVWREWQHMPRPRAADSSGLKRAANIMRALGL